VQDWLDSRSSDDEIYHVLDEHRVPYAPVLSVEEAMRTSPARTRNRADSERSFSWRAGTSRLSVAVFRVARS
jgi:crotonobetainyl-CoA:carnitine CoA-transferase CaiB-like acyl-CoA transferase